MGWASAVALGAASALRAPYRFSTDDAVSYLDIADAYRTGRWHAAINGYWSPLYSWILAAAAVVRPSPASEILMVRAVNLAMFVVAFAAFDRLLSVALRRSRSAPKVVLFALGYAAFLWSSLVWIGVRTDTPDMTAAACLYVAAALALAAPTAPHEWRRMAAMGAAAAAAYLAKAAMLPVGLAIIAVGAVVPWRGMRTAVRAACACAVFLVVAGPFVIALSRSHHHLTIGDTGPLNYVWHVYPTRRAVPNEHWQGDAPGFGTPTHPTRRVFTNPDVFEFDGPVGGTYPPWTDPGYWNDGFRLRFDAAAEERVLETNLKFYAAMVLPVIAAFYAAVFWLGDVRASVTAAVRDEWRLLVPTAVGLGVYLVATDLVVSNIPTQPSTRFIAPFVLLLLLAIGLGVRLRQSACRLVEALSFITLAAVIVAAAVTTARIDAAEAAAGPVPWVIAQRLQETGIKPGDRVAILGRKYDRDHDHEFWARLARVRIVGQVPNDYLALHLTPERWVDLCRVLSATGARLIVYKPTDGAEPAGWFPLGEGYFAYPLRGRGSEE